MTVFNEMWDGVRGMFGIKKVSCMNGGKINPNGFCDCPQYFNVSCFNFVEDRLGHFL